MDSDTNTNTKTDTNSDTNQMKHTDTDTNTCGKKAQVSRDLVADTTPAKWLSQISGPK